MYKFNQICMDKPFRLFQIFYIFGYGRRDIEFKPLRVLNALMFPDCIANAISYSRQATIIFAEPSLKRMVRHFFLEHNSIDSFFM